MKRREFIAFLGGAAVSWPLAAGSVLPAALNGPRIFLGARLFGSPFSVLERAFTSAIRELAGLCCSPRDRVRKVIFAQLVVLGIAAPAFFVSQIKSNASSPFSAGLTASLCTPYSMKLSKGTGITPLPVPIDSTGLDSHPAAGTVVTSQYIAPDKPMHNAFAENFIGLNEHLVRV